MRVKGPSPSPRHPDASHGERVDEAAGRESAIAQRPLGFEAETPVEADRRGIVGIDCEFEPPDGEPVVGAVDQSGQQRRADTAILSDDRGRWIPLWIDV